MNPTNNFFGIKVSKNGIPVHQASDKQLVYKDDFSTKTYFDTTQPRMVEGLLPDGTYGLWVSKPGFDVTDPSAPSNNELIFNSGQDIFKVVQTETVTIPGTANQAPFATGSTGLTVPHGFGYPPSYLAYAFLPIVPVGGSPPVTSWNQLLPAIASDSNQMVYNVQAGTDINNLYLVNFWSNNGNSAPVQAISVTYYLFTTTA